ncbi:MAG: iron ABC transporter permease [Deltaproteobacteria bacterium]|nr:iron ABC transporter permease [Deltaproteobacteria bacterium]
MAVRLSARVSAYLWPVGAAVLALSALWVAVGLGMHSGAVAFDAGWIEIIQGPSCSMRDILLHGRLPRAVAALLVGAALSLSGLLLQGVTRNPLADPFLLGISGGAGLAVVALQSLWPRAVDLGPWLIPAVAFGGALLAMLAVLHLAQAGGGRVSLLGLILSGVVINAFCAALITFLMARADPFRLRVTSTWLYGGLGFVAWSHLLGVALVLLGCWLFLRAQAHRLNTFGLGMEGAASVGVDARMLLRRSAYVASLLAALAVSVAGLLGYVGLIVPHVVRLAVGRDFRVTLPLAPFVGGLLLLVADVGARMAFAPEELPVGVITAVIGCPVLLALLSAQLRGRR